MSEQFKVFYCWQSDTNQNHGRYLIQEALNKAAELLATDSSIRFPVYIDQATLDEPGLCDIPNTILRKLASADAVVADLTFIAKTAATEEDSKAKYCSNPNVLFELGYAFHAIGPERIILVANELHGGVGNQIFDLQHRRFPIAYKSPQTESSRSATIQRLSEHFAEAIRAIMPLGLRSEHSSDDEIVFERQLATIRSFASQDEQWLPDSPRFEVMFRPTRYQKKRWPDASTLENDVVMKLSVRDRDGSRFPPFQNGTKRMDWGIFNNTYGIDWALTYSGQFWLSMPLWSHGEIELRSRDLLATWPRVERLTLRDGQWIAAPVRFHQIAAVFKFLKLVAGLLPDTETVKWSVYFSNLQNQWINFHGAHGDTFGPCAAPDLSREGSASVVDLGANWRSRFVDYIKDFCDLFCLDGRDIARSTLEQYATSIQ